MVMVIRINTAGDLQTGARRLENVKRNLPRMTREGMQRWGKILERDMKYAARAAGIQDWKGELQSSGIEYRQGPRSDWGYLFIRLYGIYLDDMKPHFVSVHRRRTRLLAWARDATSDVISRKARMVERGELKSFSIYVRPHPFIREGYEIARPKLKPVYYRLIQRGLAAA